MSLRREKDHFQISDALKRKLKAHAVVRLLLAYMHCHRALNADGQSRQKVFGTERELSEPEISQYDEIETINFALFRKSKLTKIILLNEQGGRRFKCSKVASVIFPETY